MSSLAIYIFYFSKRIEKFSKLLSKYQNKKMFTFLTLKNQHYISLTSVNLFILSFSL